MERWPTGRHHKPLTNIFTRPISTWNIFTLQIFIFNLTDCGRTGDINWSVSVKCHIWAGNMWHPATNVHCIVNCYSKCWVTTGTARSTVGSNLADDEEMASNNHFISVFDRGGGVNVRGVVVNEQGGKGVKCYKYRRATRAWEWLIFTTHGFYHDKSYLRMLLSPPGLGGSNVHHVWCCFLHLKLGS